MTTTLALWVLSLMHALQPSAPWVDGYGETAAEIADAASAAPVYSGPDGVARTAALLTSIAWFEGRFQPDAVGDSGASVCMMQIGASNLSTLGVTRASMLEDRATCLRAALRMIRTSFAVCRGRPQSESLGHYASGGKFCGGANGQGLAESKHRVDLAMRLVRSHPQQ